MKQLYFIITLLIIGYSTKSTSQTVSEQLIGSWILDYPTTLTLMNQEELTSYNNKNATIKVHMENTYKNRVLTFNTDGSFFQQSLNGRQVTGVWVLINNQTSIELTTAQGYKFYLIITAINSTSLVFKVPENTIGKPSISALYFNKN